MPKVSIVLTSYNHSKYLRESIDSVLNQTFSDFELVIWDDASPDNSWEIIQSYRDPRIKAYRNEKNEEASVITKALVNGLLSGEYVAIHHSDDVWEQTKLEKQVKFLDENSDVAAVFSDASAIDESSKPLNDINHYYQNIFTVKNRSRFEWLNFFFYHGNALCHPSVLVRKKCYMEVGPYKYGLAQLGDFDMWVRLCLKYEIHVYPEKLVYFRVRDNEANASGSRPETRIRHSIDLYLVLKNYLSITDSADVLKIFPFLNNFKETPDNNAHYLLAKAFLEEGSPTPAKLIGLEIYFNLLNSQNTRDKIRNTYSINYSDYVKQAALYDVFAVEELPKITFLRDQNEALKQELKNVYNSRSWNVTRPLRSLTSLLKKFS